MRAIDLYSGVGGWALGLKLAGIEVTSSYEWWNEATETHNQNLHSNDRPIDIRKLDLKTLPKPGTIDFVVGSPPCTQFSFANKGGKGDLLDGLKDIRKFLEIVDYLKPKYCVMENVPRVADILKEAIKRGGSLEHFAQWVPDIIVVNAADYGVPQQRKRMLAGKFPLDLFKNYAGLWPRRTLGDVVSALKGKEIIDPIYDLTLDSDKVTGRELEEPLSAEEARMNRDAKAFHPVYNRMSFPDRLDKPSRTVTATCTRVSRESIVIREGRRFRRLSIRERASVQGFPITYQFYGRSHASRQKMIGNALPPIIAFFLAHSFKATSPHDLAYEKVRTQLIHGLPAELPTKVAPDVKGMQYRTDRRFCSAIPGLRFGSGVRFQLTNRSDGKAIAWKIEFFFGNSKDIRSLQLDERTLKAMGAFLGPQRSRKMDSFIENFSGGVPPENVSEILQSTWIHMAPDLHPHDFVDEIGNAVERCHDSLLKGVEDSDCQNFVTKLITRKADIEPVTGLAKISRSSKRILAGFLVGSAINSKVIADEFSRSAMKV